MAEENKQSQQPQTGSTTDSSLEERDTAFLRSVWNGFFDEQEQKARVEPVRK